MKRFKNLTGKAVVAFLTFSLLSVLFLSACSQEKVLPQGAKENVSVTVINGRHYKVNGENKRTVRRGEDVTFEIALDEGYELISSLGAECSLSPFKESLSFMQNVEFSSVNYNTAVTFETREVEKTDFSAESNVESCKVEIQSASGYVKEGELYADDTINVYAVPSTGYRFHCWSTGNYLSAGGTYLSNEKILNEFDFNSTHALFANFKSTADSARTIIYDLGNGKEIEQDCSPIVAHHYKANTLTEPDLLEKGYEMPEDKMLVGWNTSEGEYVGLGSRTEVSDETYITLYPVWEEYSDVNDFVVEEGKIISYIGNVEGGGKPLVIPKSIKGETLVGIAANAFEECKVETYYLPNTITTIEENAFLNCTSLKNLYMSDNVTDISDASFYGCKNFTTLHLNAYLKPRYATAFGSLKGNIYDKLILEKNKKKCVIIGGSSVSCAYNVELSEELLKGQYDVYNLGYNRGMCAYAHYDIIDDYFNEGDIFVHAPEQNGNSWCASLSNSVLNNKSSFCFTNILLFEICECDWQLLSELTMNKYSGIFTWFNTFNSSRQAAPPQEYFNFCRVVSDGQLGGDTITGEHMLYECGKPNYVFGLNGIISLFTDDWLITLADNNIYNPLLEKGVNVCVTFAPTNRQNLFITYNDEANLKIEADKYTQQVKNLVSKDVHVLLSQYDTIYNSELFGNSDWHIAYPTRDTHTAKVMNALVDALGL